MATITESSHTIKFGDREFPSCSPSSLPKLGISVTPDRVTSSDLIDKFRGLNIEFEDLTASINAFRTQRGVAQLVGEAVSHVGKGIDLERAFSGGDQKICSLVTALQTAFPSALGSISGAIVARQIEVLLKNPDGDITTAHAATDEIAFRVAKKELDGRITAKAERLADLDGSFQFPRYSGSSQFPERQ